jgi:3-hydroxyisobutyrate dehydrogenase-like beta-hydroxyacid dehydrogenase
MARRIRKNVGLIGLGIIGSRVAENLRKKGYRVFVWNRTPRPVPNFVGSIGELAEMCDYIQIFVSDDEALTQVAEQLTPALAPRHIVFAHPTVSPQSMHQASELVERRGGRFLEAPFTGSKMAAEKGELVYYVAGDEAALKEGRPVLEASSKDIIVIGEIGQATAVKVATNIVTAASVQAAAEALALIQTVGLPLDKFVEAMRGNASNSKCLEMKLPKMIERNFEPHFSVKHMLKDIQIAIRLGLSHHIELAITAATRDRLLEQMQQGREEEDYSVVARRYLPQIISPAAAEAAAPQLFPDQVPLVPFSDIQFQPEPAAAQEPSSFVPLMPEMAAQESEISEIGAAPSSEDAELSALPAEPQLEPENPSSAAEGMSVPTPPQEEQREAAEHEGLFGRWLHRSTSSEKSSDAQEQ